MGVEARVLLVPEVNSFRPQAPELARLVYALKRDNWIAARDQPWFAHMGFDASPAEARESGGYLLSRDPESGRCKATPLPASGLIQKFHAQEAGDHKLVWPVEQKPPELRYPLSVAPPEAAQPPLYNLELWLADDFIYYTSEVVEPFADELCDCGVSLMWRPESSGDALFHQARLRARCSVCEAVYDPALHWAWVHDVFGGQPRRVPGGACFHFALVIDCAGNLPAPPWEAASDLLRLCEAEIGQPLHQIVDIH